MPARILIIDADPTLQRLLTGALRQDGHDILVASNGAEGVRRWGEEKPDLLVLDAHLPDLDGYQVAAMIRAGETAGAHLPIVMLGSAADVDARIRGLRAGADDYQTKPLHPLELQARVRSLLLRFPPRERPAGSFLGRVHAYYGAKGGVGTTTIALNTALALHREMKRKVVLVDANLQFGDHRVFLDIGHDGRSIVETVGAGADPDQLRQVLVRHDTGIDLLLAPTSPEAAEHVNGSPHHMVHLIEVLRTMYDYVIVDVDRRLDDVSLDAIGQADAIFVVITADVSCLKNVRLMLHTMDQLDVPSHKLQLVLNRSNAFTGINLKAAEGALGRGIDHQIVNDYRAAITALNAGAPFLAGKPDSLIGRSVLEFARAVDGRRERAAAPLRMAVAGA